MLQLVPYVLFIVHFWMRLHCKQKLVYEIISQSIRFLHLDNKTIHAHEELWTCSQYVAKNLEKDRLSFIMN